MAIHGIEHHKIPVLRHHHQNRKHFDFNEQTKDRERERENVPFIEIFEKKAESMMYALFYMS